MKDKKAKSLSINNLLDEHRKKDANPVSKQLDLAHENLDDQLMTQEQLDAIINYNQNVTTLDELYSSVKPISKILVRVFLLEPTKSENGLLISHKQMLPVPTNAGVGNLLEIESPYPYANKAVVVATTPISSMVQVGDIVQLESAPVRISGSGANGQIVIPAAYMHPDSKTNIVPIDPNSKHYGYLLIPVHEIQVKL